MVNKQVRLYDRIHDIRHTLPLVANKIASRNNSTREYYKIHHIHHSLANMIDSHNNAAKKICYFVTAMIVDWLSFGTSDWLKRTSQHGVGQTEDSFGLTCSPLEKH